MFIQSDAIICIIHVVPRVWFQLWFLQVSPLLTKKWVVRFPWAKATMLLKDINKAGKNLRSHGCEQQMKMFISVKGAGGVTGDSSRHCCENGSMTYSNFLTSMHRCSRFGDIGRVADDVWNLDQIAIQCETPILILDLLPAVMRCFSIVRLHRSKRHLQIWGAWFATVD